MSANHSEIERQVGLQFSVYPLRQEHLHAAIEAAVRAAAAAGLDVTVGRLSTFASGDEESVFAGLRSAPARLALPRWSSPSRAGCRARRLWPTSKTRQAFEHETPCTYRSSRPGLSFVTVAHNTRTCSTCSTRVASSSKLPANRAVRQALACGSRPRMRPVARALPARPHSAGSSSAAMRSAASSCMPGRTWE